jgi:hypothetical protein
MRRRNVLVITAVAFVTFGIACVDLFHSTDFETLCTRSPNDPHCAADASTPDVVDADARRPHPNFCDWTSAEARLQALRACAWLGACEGTMGATATGGDDNVLGPCVIRAQLAYDCAANPSLRPAGETDELWSCLATAKTCGDVDQCVFPAGVEKCPKLEGTFLGCGARNAGVRVRCTTAPTEARATGVEVCALRGKTCSRDSTSTSECLGAGGYNCTTIGCVDGSAVDCTSGEDHGFDCASAGGAECVPADAGGTPFCSAGPNAPSCGSGAIEMPPVCDDGGAIVRSCVKGQEIRVDCNRLGLACNDTVAVPTYDPAAACVADASAEPCTEPVDRCRGTHLLSCGRGAPYEVDCVGVALGGCNAPDGGHAACAPPDR